MTDAAKPLAVDDVLTSIRRLLAQDGPASAEPSDSAPMSIEHTLAALEAAMAGRRLPEPAPVVPEPAEDTVADESDVLVLPVQPELADEAEPVEGIADDPAEPEEAPFIAIDMPDAASEPSFSFRHKAEIRRLQLVTPPEEAPVEDEERVETVQDIAPAPVLEAVAEVPVMPIAPAPVEVEVAIAPVPEAAFAPRPVLAQEVPRQAIVEDAPRSIFEEHDELPIDREVLRRLIGEVLREELQGALGERMTRNVKKLVRAEIRRALADE